MERKLIVIGLSFIAASIMLGAFAAHGLKSNGVSSEKIDSFVTGVKYLMYSGLFFLILSAIREKFDFNIRSQYRQILWGTLIFSTSIFALVLTPLLDLDLKFILGPLTPVGGVIMIIGYLGLLIKYIRT